MAIFKKDDRPPYQKSRFFIAGKRVGLSLSQNIYLILDYYITNLFNEKCFELFCVENDFAKNYFAKQRNLFKHFVLLIMIIPRNDTFLYYRTSQLSLCCIIL